MIRRIGEKVPVKTVRMADASYPAPFESGLEYSAPARGTWNIVHVGMLMPQAHQIFVCAQGCLRGVVLTAAEMGASERFSTVATRENNVLDGDMEQLIIDGVSDILDKLPLLPPAVLVYTSCIHHFMACDLDLVYSELRRRYPSVKFTDCYMNPIMRKSGLTPDQLMRRQLYRPLDELPVKKNVVSIIGNDFALEDSNELHALLSDNGIELREITRCKTFDEYLKMAESSVYITTYPSAVAAGKELESRFPARHIYMSVSFDYDEMTQSYMRLCELLGITCPDFSPLRERCEKRLDELANIIGDTPIAIDYTAFSRPLSLARMLLSHGFNVKSIFADSFSGEESRDFEVIKKIAPELEIHPTVHPTMRVFPRENTRKILAIGQKAAYFSGTEYFVNIVENGGLFGFDGILRLCDMMHRAFEQPKDTRALIQIKGMGCGCCQ